MFRMCFAKSSFMTLWAGLRLSGRSSTWRSSICAKRLSVTSSPNRATTIWPDRASGVPDVPLLKRLCAISVGTARPRRILPPMDRRVLLDHLRRIRLVPGDRDAAQCDARRIARFLQQQGARRVIGIGSAFASDRRFTRRSDIDLAVEGLAPEKFFRVSGQAADMTGFALDIVPVETATDAMRQAIVREGVDL